MLAGMLHHVRWLTMSPFELQMSHAKFCLLSRREFQSISRVLEHHHCSCPLAGKLEKHRTKLARPRCGPQHFQTSLVSKQTRTADANLSPETSVGRHFCREEELQTENIYEVIQPEGRRKISAAESLHSCLNISSRRNYKQLESSNEEEEENRNLTLNKIIFCFSCLCD